LAAWVPLRENEPRILISAHGGVNAPARYIFRKAEPENQALADRGVRGPGGIVRDGGGGSRRARVGPSIKVSLEMGPVSVTIALPTDSVQEGTFYR